MKNILLISISLMIVSGVIFASQENSSRYAAPKTKYIPRMFPSRSSLFEPSEIVSQEEHEALELEDMENSVEQPSSQYGSTSFLAIESNVPGSLSKLIPVMPTIFEQNITAENGIYLQYQKDQLVRDNSQSPSQKYRLASPWKSQEDDEDKDDVISNVNAIITYGNQQELMNFLQGKNLANIHDFDTHPLLTAIMFDKIEMIAPLAAAGANVSIKDENGIDVIGFAEKNSNSLMVVELLKAYQKQYVDTQKNKSFSRISPVSISSVSPFCYDEIDK